MMTYMNSKVFQNEFLTNEDDKDILNAQYILVSTMIRKRSKEVTNIINGYTFFYPSNSVFDCNTEESMKEEYFDQLDKSLSLIATLILGAIEKRYTIVFLCSKSESQLNYLGWLADYIYTVFGYPVYDYKDYSNYCALIDYDEDEIAKKCRKTIERSAEISHEKNKRTIRGRERLRQEIERYDKKRLKKELKKIGLYSPNLTKSEMREFLLLNL